MKTRITILLAALFLSPSILFAAPKIATFDFNQIVTDYEAHQNDIAIYEAENKNLYEDPRKKALDEMGLKVKALQEKGRTLRKGTEEYSRILQEGEDALEAYRDLQNKWKQFFDENSRNITKSLVKKSKAHVTKIIKIANEIGETQGFDWVLETSGRTNSKMPVILYVRNSTDITELIMKELNKETAAE